LEEFNSYIKNIAVFTILMVFADIIMPDRFSKKYVSFVMGIVLAVNALGPIIRIADKGFDIDIIMNSVQDGVLENENKYSDELFKSIFEENLSAEIERELKSKGIEFESILPSVTEDENGIFILENISITADDENYHNAKTIIEEKYAPKEIAHNQ